VWARCRAPGTPRATREGDDEEREDDDERETDESGG